VKLVYFLCSIIGTLLRGQIVREERTIEVHGVIETWKLEWRSPPKSGCGPDDPGNSLVFACAGFAYGERGDLELVRVHPGLTDDRLSLNFLFAHSYLGLGTILQKWPTDPNDSMKGSDLFAKVRKRPVVSIMQIADYDNDGTASEFFLHTNTLPSTKQEGVIVGLQRRRDHLSVFGSAKRPNIPLLLLQGEWEALRKSRHRVETLAWACGDHGSPTETVHLLTPTQDGIEVIEQVYECSIRGRGRLKSSVAK
jgi:hypothetical protein